MNRLWLCLLLACGGAETHVAAQPPTEPAAPVSTAPAAQATSSAAAPATTNASALPAPMRQALDVHNRARAEHCAPPLTWSAEVASAAAAWADQLVAQGCAFEHSRSAYGENLFMGTTGGSSPADVVTAWVSERDQYDFGSGGFSMETGHFTQVVWMSTQRLGCAVRTCNNMDLWVCNYDAPGNMRGAYPQNVQPTSCR